MLETTREVPKSTDNLCLTEEDPALGREGTLEDPGPSPEPEWDTLPEGHRSGFVSIVGRPNAGKSTLLNRLVETKVAIVSEVPQTTRHRIVGILTRPDFQIVFVDTPGIHKPLHEMNRRMLRLTYEALEDVDVVLYIADASVSFGSGERFALERMSRVPCPVLLLLNKVDKIKKSRLLPLIEQYQETGNFAECIPISALTGDGVDILLTRIREYLPEGPRYYPEGQVTDLPLPFLLAELVREQVFQLTREEVPHSSAVVIESVEEGEDGVLVVRATVYVEKENQKRIVIGKAGRMLRDIGTAARREMERLLGRKVYLDLWVKASSRWREDSRMLDRVLDPGRV